MFGFTPQRDAVGCLSKWFTSIFGYDCAASELCETLATATIMCKYELKEKLLPESGLPQPELRLGLLG